MADFKEFIAKVADGNSLSIDEAKNAFDIIMAGEATPAQIGGFLMGLRVKGETVEEISGAVLTMRSNMLSVSASPEAIDLVGTGGDNLGTYNISTCAAIVVAGCGVVVAKHGNRNLSSKSGAADVLKSLGVNVEITPDKVSDCIEKIGLGFMFAPSHHPAMRFVGPARQEMGVRTIFNLLGPLSNPAGVKKQLIGVFAEHWVEPIAHVLNELGSKRLWIVHGRDGLDEISTTGPTFVAELKDGKVETFEITPEDGGLPFSSLEDLKGGDADENAEAIKGVLEGERNPYRDVVLLNAAAALIIAGKSDSLAEGVNLAAKAIESGSAKNQLEKLVKVTNG